jgi:hypothetical protein
LDRASALDQPNYRQGCIIGWKLHNGIGYTSFHQLIPGYVQIGQCETTDSWTCDITDVHGFQNSKSNLRDFVSTDDMVESNSPDLIDEITPERLSKNLSHREIRIIHSPGTDYFARHLWDGRLFLMNGGGSHHFAAAKYIASRLGRPVPMRGTLRTYSLNENAIAALRRDYEMLVISNDASVFSDFYEAMRAFRATWLWHQMPEPYRHANAILLPKSERRSVRVARLLLDAGVVDLGLFLADLAAQQSRLYNALVERN